MKSVLTALAILVCIGAFGATGVAQVGSLSVNANPSTVSSGVPTDITFEIGNMTPNTEYDIKVDIPGMGTKEVTVTTDENGKAEVTVEDVELDEGEHDVDVRAQYHDGSSTEQTGSTTITAQ